MIALRWNIAQFFERLWWQNYLRAKDNHRYLEWKRNYWQKILQQVFELMDDKTVKENFKNNSLDILDAGCGPAGIFLNLENHRVDAMDPLVEKYLGGLRLIERPDFPRVNFIPQQLENFPAPEKYDFIFCMNCINHVKDMEVSLKNLSTSLKHQGFLVVTVDAHNYNIVKSLLQMIPADILHPCQLRLQDYAEAITKTLKTKNLKRSLLKQGILFNHYLMVAQKI